LASPDLHSIEMSALSIRLAGAQRLAVASAAAALAVLTLAAVRYGAPALALPLAAVAALALLQRARLAVALAVALPVLIEGSGEDFLGVPKLYNPFGIGMTPAETLLAIAVLAVLLDRMRAERPLRLAGPLTVPLALVVLAAAAGITTAAFSGVSAKEILFAARQLVWLPLVPLLIVNVVETPRQLRGALALGAGLAVVKAAIGVSGVVAGVGIVVEGATITYYEPTANWLVLLALLGTWAALLMRGRPPGWAIAATPLLIASLTLSFRRSFWVGAVLALLLVFLLGSRPLGRRIAVVGAVLLGLAAWTVSLQPLQTETPIVERARSLQPSKVESNAQDRYRLDELRNVTAAIRDHPITGLGLGGQWRAIHPLAIEHENGRGYTHVVVLWWWMKLGVLGLLAYLSLIATMLAMSWQVWRRSADRLLSAVGLGTFCGVLALVIVETVGSFTGIDPRFTALVGAVGGLLAVMRRLALSPLPQ
jgi:O-antigen ligase/polysaccharide polymerase Wzy-like membrane protein